MSQQTQRIDLDALEAALAYYNETGIDKVDFNALPALIAELRQLRAYRDDVEAYASDVKTLLESCKGFEAEAADLRARTTPEVISDRHKDGRYWMVWDTDYRDWIVARWKGSTAEWRVEDGRVLYTPSHALPMPGEVKNA